MRKKKETKKPTSAVETPVEEVLKQPMTPDEAFEEPKSVLNIVPDEVQEEVPAPKETPSENIGEAKRDFDPGKALDFREFDYGNLTFECQRCGHSEVLEKDVEGGIQITLPTTDKHNWTLVCGRCKNTMKLFFTESSKKKIKGVEEAVIVEDEKKEVPNELEKESKGE